MTQVSVITTMLISRNHIVRLGVQSIIEKGQRIRLINPPSGTASTDETIAREQPEVIMIDLEPDMDLPALLRRLKAAAPRAKLIVLIGFEDAKCLAEAFSSGLDGVILKMQPPEAMVACIESLCEAPMKPIVSSLTATIKSPVSETPLSPAPVNPYDFQRSASLTQREREIISLVGQGLSNKDIAERLCISGITVRHHLTSIFDKLGVATRQKLLIRAHQYGLVQFSSPA